MDESTLSPDVQRHLARATVYTFTATAFTPPDEGAVEVLSDQEAQEGALVAAGRIEMADHVGDVLDAFNEADPDELARAYDDLFHVPDEDGSYPVVPYEAHYTVGDDVGKEQRRIALVLDVAREIGMEPNDDFTERQDHVVTELELMQILSAQRAHAMHDGDEEALYRIHDVEGALLDEHLVGFAPALAEDVQEATDHPFYEAAAELMAEHVRRDHGTQVGDGAASSATSTPEVEPR